MCIFKNIGLHCFLRVIKKNQEMRTDIPDIESKAFFLYRTHLSTL